MSDCPMPEGCEWRNKINMTIEDANGENWEMTFKGPKGDYIAAMKHNYLLLSHIFQTREDEVEPEMTKIIRKLMPFE